MSSVVINKKHFAFISAPATKRVERLLKSTELRREAGETCKSCPRRTSNGRMQASARFSCCHQESRAFGGKAAALCPRAWPAALGSGFARAPSTPARPAGGFASSRRPGPSRRPTPASSSATPTGRRLPTLFGRAGPARRLTCSRATMHGPRRDEALRVLPSVLPRYSSQVALLADTILAPWQHQAELR
jgi:hypothetical protein